MVTYRKDETQRPEGWNDGAPPHVGWWSVEGAITSLAEDNMWRSWWDGAKWSAQENSTSTDGSFAWNSLGSFRAGNHGTRWCWAWPENARVARVNPETGEVTGSGPCPYETDGKPWPFGEVKEKAADAPKLKKKPAGNRKVTRYVVMTSFTSAGYGLPIAVFEDEALADAYAQKERTMHFYPLEIKKIRFRTPEA